MSDVDVLDEAEAYLRRRISSVELIGEVPISRPEADNLCRALGRKGWRRASLAWPHCLAVALISVARFRYDGDSFWPHVADAFGFPREQAHYHELGEWFESYLRKNGLPTFAHLVEQGALRFLTPILGHALIPSALVPAYMEHVIWPSVADPWRNGATAEEIQERVARRQAPMARPLKRFIVHGGRVARDVLERSLELSDAAAHGESLPDGLPDWLRDAIVQWAQESKPGRQRGRGSSRPKGFRPPVLRFDREFGQVDLELVYPGDEGAEWEVDIPGEPRQRIGYLPMWKRHSPAEVVPVRRPFPHIDVVYRSVDGRKTERRIPGITEDQPYLIFDGETGRRLADQRYLTDSSFYLLVPSAATVRRGGDFLSPVADFGEPSGVWPGFAVRLYAMDSATPELEFTANTKTVVLRRMEQGARAVLDVPPPPPYLDPLSEGRLAFESRLPTIILPPPQTSMSNGEYLKRWDVRAICDDTPSEWRTAAELNPEVRQDGAVVLRLEPLIPGPDVGEWEVEVRGPMGRGVRERLVLLPDISFDVPEAFTGVAGPSLPVARVLAHTREGIEVLEEGDARAPAADGWELLDRNRNGRIPFRVHDSRTGRQAHAVLKLPVVQWRWVGHGADGLEANAPLRLVVEKIGATTAPRLRVHNPTGRPVRLCLLGPRGAVLQEDERDGRAIDFDIATFLTTLRERVAASAKFRLELVGPGGTVAGAAEVASVQRHIELQDVRVSVDGDGVVVTWRLDRTVPDLRLSVASLTRPWEPPLSERVEVNDEGLQAARLPRVAPGPYELRLVFEDDWAGTSSLGSPAVVTVGDPASLEVYQKEIRGQRGVTGRLEHLLLTTEADDRNEPFARLVEGLSAAELSELLGVLFRACETGRAGVLFNLPWVDAAVAVTRLGPQKMADVLRCVSRAPRSVELKRVIVATGLDRAWGVRGVDLPADVRRELWSLWAPLGSFIDVPRSTTDPEARGWCEDYLGFPPRALDTEADPSGDCEGDQESPILSDEWRKWPTVDVGSVEGPEFQPESRRLEAMRDQLSPVASRPFDSDGWIVTCFSALEPLASPAAEAVGDLEAITAPLARFVSFLEGKVKRRLPGLNLDARRGDYRMYPWAFICRASLVVAAVRRLLAWGGCSLSDEQLRSLDDAAVLLTRLVMPVYERDLLVAEIHCCREFAWNRLNGSTQSR
ncbi:MAG: hypothetical protein KatS3mg015_3158 [Fimbriimonadales bacterium]|nr:MAG: hypothetical protein KatS3mg015_3158 [Fimbriimonadales bacterium]